MEELNLDLDKFRIRTRQLFLEYSQWIDSKVLYSDIIDKINYNKNKINFIKCVCKIAHSGTKTLALINFSNYLDFTDRSRFSHRGLNPKMYKILNWNLVKDNFYKKYKDIYPLNEITLENFNNNCIICNSFIDETSEKCKECEVGGFDVPKKLNEISKPPTPKSNEISNIYIEEIKNLNIRIELLQNVLNKYINSDLISENEKLNKKNSGFILFSFGCASKCGYDGGPFSIPSCATMNKGDKRLQSKTVVFLCFTTQMIKHIRAFLDFKISYEKDLDISYKKFVICKELIKFKEKSIVKKFRELCPEAEYADLIGDYVLRNENMYIINKSSYENFIKYLDMNEFCVV